MLWSFQRTLHFQSTILLTNAANSDVFLVKCNETDWFGSAQRNSKLYYSENVFCLNVYPVSRNISLNLHQNIYQSLVEIKNAQKLLDN